MKGRTIRVAITIGAGLATLFISSSVASAHTQLLSTTPQAGQILRESPARVSATFDQILLPTGDAMVVTDAEHNFVDIGTAQLDGPTISIHSGSTQIDRDLESSESDCRARGNIPNRVAEIPMDSSRLGHRPGCDDRRNTTTEDSRCVESR